MIDHNRREDDDSDMKGTAMTNQSRFAKGTVEVTVKYLKALRRAVGLEIDPETAEVEWIYAGTLDPYGDYPELPEELQQVGREYFARSPGSDIWVDFGDLPEATRRTLWEKHKSKLAVSCWTAVAAGNHARSPGGLLIARVGLATLRRCQSNIRQPQW